MSKFQEKTWFNGCGSSLNFAITFGLLMISSFCLASAAHAATPKQIDINIMVDQGTYYPDPNIYEVSAATGAYSYKLTYRGIVDNDYHYRISTMSTAPNTGWVFTVTVPSKDTNWKKQLMTYDSPMVIPLRYDVNNSGVDNTGFTYVDVGGVLRDDPDPLSSIRGNLEKYTVSGKTNYRINPGASFLALGTNYNSGTTWSGTTPKLGTKYDCTYRGNPSSSTTSSDRTCKKYVAPVVAAATGPAGVTFRLFPEANACASNEAEALTCWIGVVFKWSQTAIMLLSTVAFVVAGVIYMTSAGNTKQIELAKKIIFGALSAVATIILGKFFLTVVVGVPWV